jgi:bifunctional DNA-binding transcriptional regulator/antitoxin component of YhaV-PrlF toxin-antitoxin module
MKRDVVPIDQAGRIVLPRNVCEELAIKTGDAFIMTIAGETVTLTPNRESTGFVRKGKALVFSTPGSKALNEETVRQILGSSRDDCCARPRR